MRFSSAMPGAIEVALTVAVRDGKVLVARRAEGAHLGGFWEFPGGKIRPGEDAPVAAGRELLEETGLSGGAIEPLIVHAFDYPDRSVRLHAFVVREPEGVVRVDDGREWAWVTAEEAASLRMPDANGPILRALRWRLGA